MATNHWFRWYHATTIDPKFRTIARKAGRPLTEVLCVWAYLLEQASQSTPRGCVDGVDLDDIETALDVPVEHVRSIIDQMRGRVLDDSATMVSAWDKRQPKREDAENSMTSTERSRIHRERKKADMQRNATQCNAMQREGTQRDDIIEERRGDNSIGDNPPIVPPRGDVSEGFAAFWGAYPRKVGKGQAEKAYTKALKASDHETIMAACLRYAAERAGQDPQYTRHAATWLNGQGWLDEPAAPQTTRGQYEPKPVDREEQRRAAARERDRADRLAVLRTLGLVADGVDDGGPAADWGDGITIDGGP